MTMTIIRSTGVILSPLNHHILTLVISPVALFSDNSPAVRSGAENHIPIGLCPIGSNPQVSDQYTSVLHALLLL